MHSQLKKYANKHGKLSNAFSDIHNAQVAKIGEKNIIFRTFGSTLTTNCNNVAQNLSKTWSFIYPPTSWTATNMIPSTKLLRDFQFPSQSKHINESRNTYFFISTGSSVLNASGQNLALWMFHIRKWYDTENEYQPESASKLPTLYNKLPGSIRMPS